MTLRYSHLSPSHRANAVAILDRVSSTMETPIPEWTQVDTTLWLARRWRDK